MKTTSNSIIPETPVVLPPEDFKPEPQPKDLSFEKQPGILLKENGILFMTKAFNEENCMPLVKMIYEYNLMPKDKAPEIIHLYINSPGGEVMYCWQLIDAIKQSRIPVYTYAQGLAASCGCVLLMSGAKRFATHNAQIMSHVYSAGSGGKEHDLYARVKSFDITSKNMVDHYKKCTGKNEKYIRKHLLPAEDVWLTPEEAVKHGIIDEVVETY